jgi:ABC-type molybdate transport system substrate-binding protein
VKLLDISKDGRVLGIKSTDYPFRRYYFAYVTEKTPDTKAFLEFVLSDRGQKALLPSGLYPLPDSALIKAREELARQ